MSPRLSKLLYDATIVATLILAAAVGRAAYTRATGHGHVDCGCRRTNDAAPPARPHIVCAFPIAEECRKLDWWPE